jgi:putative oxygen-independent coproporphyrinogen III oxidase
VTRPRDVPLALYIHLPWCVRKCPYCDFNSHALPSAGIPQQAYVAALLEDLGFAARDCADREIVSVFFGGGTPSLFSPDSVAQVLRGARDMLPFASGAEVTLEANPGTLERGRFADYAAAGVNRVSLGAQSFDDGKLEQLGRIHAGREIEAAVADLRAAGMTNFNLDLMYALPEQTLGEALHDVERAIELAPTHVSHYQLTLEAGTPFARRPPSLPDDETAYDMQVACQERLAAAGYAQYEISAYARPGRHCTHNLNYWQYGDYLGIGAGAHGKLTALESGRIERTARVRHPAGYLAADSPAGRIADSQAVGPEDRPFEFALNALRLLDGFDWPLFESRTGLSRHALDLPITAAVDRALLEERPAGGYRPTPLGTRFLNDLQRLFLPETSK